MPELKTYTREEVKKHNVEGDAWIIIDSEVYNISTFADLHPGGAQILIELAGKDVTDDFYGLHRQEVLLKFAPRLKIGTIVNEEPSIRQPESGDLSIVPYGEPSFWMGFHSPYYNESHTKFRIAIRKIFSSIQEEAQQCEESGKPPSKELYMKLGEQGVLAAQIGPGPWMKHIIKKLPGDIKPEEFDYFHELIAHQENARLNAPGFADGVSSGYVIGLPPVIHGGSKELRERIVPEVLLGKKRICLAITEPYTGSDVASIRTTAKRTPDGKHFIVNGVKKWITNGLFADYFSVAVKTDKGITMLLVERDDSVETKPIKTSYSAAAGTSYITFDNVKVPVGNILGEEGKGFFIIMANFCKERWYIIAAVNAASRAVTEECFKWANQRKVFGKRLIEQPVIRNKLASMISEVEAVENWHENLTYQMSKMSPFEMATQLLGPVALLKFRATRTAHNVSDDASQIFGGRAITRTGMGKNVEAFQRTYKFAAILGGSEEIMADLGINQALRIFPQESKL
ncbi:acyl-CoA dehydrogenase/oxidase [Halteromyces radiatus]|uniref:acyl-CoA dehydrogenase/oxidase n=1 Tax=Halteromyces radiatus TaxID=101107 RepID=UPI00221F6FC0|nr:acyl-CoA dehydrogenase/oxidase [Halteromyces radiatus]KAI8092749.1 acyl-CoA dehydrogenase/oxidase [Halteromyces radiatus]